MSPIQQMLLGAVGTPADPVYIDDVFSTTLYRGTANTAKTITNNIDLATDGGMVVIRAREANSEWSINDTVNGAGKSGQWESTSAYNTQDESVYSYTTSGFTLPSAWAPRVNTGKNYLSYTFKKEKKFFDIVQYSGNGVSTGRAISHSLGSVPGMMMVKRTDSSTSGQWWIYHRSLPDGKGLQLQTDDGQQSDGNNYWGTGSSFVHPTASQFTVGSYPNVNGATYIAYLFAHNEASFGADSDKSLIHCGTYTGNGSTTGTVVNLGFEPQLLLLKCTTDHGTNWEICDSMRGVGTDTDDTFLCPNNLSAPDTFNGVDFTATGFQLRTTGGFFNKNNEDYIFLAIRRPDGYVGKQPANNVKAFTLDVGGNRSTVDSRGTFDSDFPVDFAFYRQVASTGDWGTMARSTTKFYYQLNKQSGWEGTYQMDSSIGWAKNYNSTWYSWMFRRHKGMDVVCYNGQNSAQTITHNMNATPEMIWVKSRSDTSDWYIGHIGLDGGTAPWTHYIRLNHNQGELDSDAAWNDTAPTSTAFSVGPNSNHTNISGRTYTAFLFASANDINDNPISKVGYLTGGGSSGTTVTLGFKPRFLLMKNTQGGWHWQLFDSLRGLGTATHQNDIAPNDRDAQDSGTNWITASDTGFSSPHFASGNTYIYYAHA